jgi:hypothetical protein
MPQGCLFYVDEQKRENCRVNFDANLYNWVGMRAMLDRYLRLLEAAALKPELPIGTLLTIIGAKPFRWTCANYAAPFYELVTALYAKSRLLKKLWRPVKGWVSSSG